jgi:hypothetical protein
VGAAVASGDDVSSLSAGTGYAIDGQFDFGLRVARSWADRTDWTSNSLSPQVGYYPVRQDADIPLSIRIGAGYTYEAVDDPWFGPDIDISAQSVQTSGILFHRLTTSDQFGMIPYAEGYFLRRTRRVEGQTTPQKTNETIFGAEFGIGLVFTTTPDRHFALRPFVGIAEGAFSGGVSVVLVFPVN